MTCNFSPLLLFACATLLLSGCVSSTKNIPVVTDFSITRAQGVWFEVAKSHNNDEPGRTPVFYTWKLVPGLGGLFNAEQYIGRRRIATAEAQLAGQSGVGELKLYFSLFSRRTVRIIELNESNNEYQSAIVCGDSIDELLILCRRPKIRSEELSAMIERASEFGFYVDIVRTRPNATNLDN